MPIRYPVDPATIVICDFSKGGFQPPEMVKRRPAVVVSARLKHRGELLTVVPLSTTAPRFTVPYIVELSFPEPLAPQFPAPTMWAKCDMIAAVAFHRVDLIRRRHPVTGEREYEYRKLTPDEFAAVRLGVLTTLEMGN